MHKKHFNKDENQTTRTTNDEEVEVLEPPPKVTPLCVDLDDESTSPSRNELDAELSAASRPAVAPTPDPVHVAEALLVPLPVSETTATSQVPCPVPLSSQNISCPVVTQPSPLKESSSASTSTVQSFDTPLDQSREQAGTSNHLNESAERRNAAFQKITDLQSEEQREKDRIASIERTIEELNSELKALTDKVLSLKQQQFDVLLSTMATNPFENDSASRFSEPTTTTSKTLAATESAQPVVEASSVLPIPPAASTELLSLMHQLEENGVHGDPVVTVSVTTKRRRIPSSESTPKKLKGTTSSPSRNTVDIPPVEKPQQVPTNGETRMSLTASFSSSFSSSFSFSSSSSSSSSSASASASSSSASSSSSSSSASSSSSSSANASKRTQKATDVNSRSIEYCRTSSRREESSTQKATPKSSKVNAKPSEAASKLPAPATESNSAKDAACATPPASTSRVAISLAPARQPASTSACETHSTHPVMLLPPHLTAVRCVLIHGPCACTASEDGTVHIYDLKTNSLVKKIFGHTHPVTWLYGISFNTSSEVLSTIKSTTEYLKQLTLITGSEDAHIRQFSLDSGALIEEKFCSYSLTCVAGHVALAMLYVGTEDGVIFTYNPRDQSIMRINKFKVNGEVICMKIALIRGKTAIIVAAKQMDPIVFDLETEDSLFTLASKIPRTSFYCLSSSSKYVFCCDGSKKVFIFDAKMGGLNYIQTTLPSAAVSSFLHGKRFLVLGCMDGVIRLLDTRHKPSYPMFTLPGHPLKTITSMDVVGDMIIAGSLNGEVLYQRLPNIYCQP